MRLDRLAAGPTTERGGGGATSFVSDLETSLPKRRDSLMIATIAPAGRTRGLRAQMVEKIADRFAQSVLGGAQQEWQLCAAFFVCGCDSIVSAHKREKQMAVARVETATATSTRVDTAEIHLICWVGGTM